MIPTLSIATTRGRGRLLANLEENARLLEELDRTLRNDAARGRELAPAAVWLLENRRLVREQVRTVRQEVKFAKGNRASPSDGAALGNLAPGDRTRVYALVREYICRTDGSLDETELHAFVAAYEKTEPLRLGELWAFPNLLRLGLLEHLRRAAAAMVEQGQAFLDADAAPPAPAASAASNHNVTPNVIQNVIQSLRALGQFDWDGFVEEQSVVERILRQDPAGAYGHMDFSSRDHYRHAVERLARRSRLAEGEVARAAIERAAASASGNGSAGDGAAVNGPTGNGAAGNDLSGQPEAARQRHVGYWLVGGGLAEFAERIGYRLAVRERLARLTRRHALACYLAAITIVWVATVVAAAGTARYAGMDQAIGLVPQWLLLLCFAGAAGQFAVSIVNWLATLFVAPRRMDRLDFSAGIPREHRTLVAVPTMLTGEPAVQTLVEQLELRYLANVDEHLLFALLTDFPDADQESLPNDARLLELARAGISRLNATYCGDRPSRFFLLHRPRKWNPREGVWMAEERKRGKLAALSRLIRTGSADAFNVTHGDLSELSSVRYVITLDTDTQLPRDSARRLAACIAHPLNRPRIDPVSRRVVEGHAVLQPRIGVTVRDAHASPYSRLFCGEAGIDPYTRETSDVYQDLFDEGSFIGKGIYDVEAFERALNGRFPDDRVLSHDLIEGCFARCGLVSDVELYEAFPTRVVTDMSRRHRWIRGDWQIAAWIWPTAPTRQGAGPNANGAGPNAIGNLSRWKIFDNLRRSVTPLFLAAFLLLAGAFVPGFAGLWGAAVLGLLLGPSLLRSLWCCLRKPAGTPVRLHATDQVRGCLKAVVSDVVGIVFLPYVVHCHLDAIVRTLYRLHVSGRKLLQWTTAGDTETKFTGTLRSHYALMGISTMAAVAVTAAFLVLHPSAAAWAAPLLAVWTLAPALAWRISRPSETPPARAAVAERSLRRWARLTWHYFETWVTEEGHGLPPDNVRKDMGWGAAHRTSPTNLGLGLLADLAACDLGYLLAETLLDRSGRMLRAMRRLERHRGHFYNWYDTRTLQPLEPRYVSSVDSGNLWAALTVLKHGLEDLPDRPLVPPRLAEGLHDTLDAIQTVRDGEEPFAGCREFDARLARIRRVLDRGMPQTAGAARTLLHRFRTLAETLPAHVPPTRSALTQWTQALVDQAQAIERSLARLAFWSSHPVPSHASGGDPLREPWQRADGNPRLREQILGELRGLVDRLDAACTLRELPQAADRVVQLIDRLQPAGIESDAEEFRPDGGTDRGSARAIAATSPPRRIARDAGRRAVLALLRSAADNAAKLARRQMQEIAVLSDLCDEFSAPDFGFLLDPRQKLLTIGFDVTHHRRDENCYGFLASEARLASYLAISHGQIPGEHWFAMDRAVTLTDGKPTLLSWSGSMFEYLMPMLLMPSCPATFLDVSCRAAVRRQIYYGRRRGVPWGISESSYHAFDGYRAYQYRGFGVPGLGVARGLSEDLVVAPYAAALAVMVAPREAVENLLGLEQLGFLSPYGFYDAIDYTPDRRPSPDRGAPCRTVMAHHSAMTLLAFAHVLLDGIMQRRFMKTPCLRAHEFLLQERIPIAVRPIDPLKLDVEPHGQTTSPAAVLRSTAER